MNKHSKGMSEMISIMDIKNERKVFGTISRSSQNVGVAPLRRSNGEPILAHACRGL